MQKTGPGENEFLDALSENVAIVFQMCTSRKYITYEKLTLDKSYKSKNRRADPAIWKKDE